MKTIKIALAAVGTVAGIAAVSGAVAFLVAPEKPSKAKCALFYGRNFAHRGLHKKNQAIPENSLSAFAAAVHAGYGIELDVRLSADGIPVVFHDDNLLRVCGAQGCIEVMTWSELENLRLFNSEEGIPRLRNVFELVGGRIPIIVELKRGPRNRELCARTLDEIRLYGGPVCVQSFDPFIVGWFRKKAPDLLRGQLTSSRDNFEEDISRFASSILSRVLLNFISRPNYIAHGNVKKSLFVRLSEAMGAMKVVWTAHGSKSESGNDAVIFEYYRPDARFK